MNRRPDWGTLYGAVCVGLVIRHELEQGTPPLWAVLAGTGYVSAIYFLGRLLFAAIWRISDRIHRHKPDSIVPDDQVRLMRLTDNPWPDFIGKRAWCDGRRTPCPCGDRCCSCQHYERPRL